ncbi:plasmid mobilization protein [Xanthomonas hortorum pv. pelargonii]|uniref:plasmid mobilization protein n=1 Tax=Xanthomonas hortorum TaxID=56454 RepID=UPI0021C76E71|nr:plasmid mobilization protein [Xanthomonas hortorum]MCU1706793.1 plasmid mobilization protein [Xanthomonas hortorum pv. pelargonii]MCU1715356.1 plasmid mobilization protein [Xanthomonas hortorum pv. pelargonii]UXN02116.1 plasmid mobilization protein [Xanthomonas hortorum pv. pelargonii]UXN02147.1 plasmid mobilization protein [Xanthomonas hortorum pv. pelargonii]
MAAEKLESLRAKKAQIAALISKLEAREADRMRKERTKALILFGTAIEKQLKKGDEGNQLRALILGNLAERDGQRALSYIESISQQDL